MTYLVTGHSSLQQEGDPVVVVGVAQTPELLLGRISGSFTPADHL